jgi:5-enolpyruvylshikimate-3-phosphate synthase
LSTTFKIKGRIGTKPDTLSLELPGSKSITNRVLLLSALGEGTITLKGVLDAEDTRIMINALKGLKACTISELVGNTLTITGNGGKISTPDAPIYVGNTYYVI